MGGLGGLSQADVGDPDSVRKQQSLGQPQQDIGDILQQIMAITDESLDEAQASGMYGGDVFGMQEADASAVCAFCPEPLTLLPCVQMLARGGTGAVDPTEGGGAGGEHSRVRPAAQLPAQETCPELPQDEAGSLQRAMRDQRENSLPAEREAWEKRATKWKVCVRTGEVNGQNFSKRHFGYQPTRSGIGVIPSTLRCKCADLLDDRMEALTV
ncbi:Pre-B-cell leukemia transcription factor 4 Homeobox protein PBX4 [Triplophysa tibetana]|uniref:Pre-B-cell leukemia transcription factor 4 Homeobox protein PBX4 n=1 Tax=Triplophysa tibetana TaxID=1572043 RepID=A0A5A9N5T0_9TELE|nr:Pre-B-cell leukemia transcription factor 4 Homeobox protein PBX4 [Triplophysa tibetana]